MKPPYKITARILHLVATISEKVGAINATYLDKPSTHLRKQNKIKTIHSSLKIEGNTLTESQITALLENKRVIGPKKDVLEVLNAIDVYDNLSGYNYYSEKSFLKSHQVLMKNLIPDAGSYRKQGVGIVKGNKVEHLAPPYKNVPFLMGHLFKYLKESKDIELIKSCVFHYEVEFIHPFLDGNGRMGRLWQTVILMHKYPVFEFLPFENLISADQEKYYQALAASDKAGNSTFFIEYMLGTINRSLESLLNSANRIMTPQNRLDYFIENWESEFTRKDYLNVFKDISSATASRDLKKGIENKQITKTGDKNNTIYKVL